MKQYDNALPKGTILKGKSCQYLIEKVLGQGSFGITYLASVKIVGTLGTIEANRNVAIKEFFMDEINQRAKEGKVEGMTEGSLSYKYKQRFRKEAENISKLNHPNIVKVVDFIEANQTFYYVMEYVDGEDLQHYMNGKPLPTDEAVRIIKEVSKALSYMHEEKNMLHLDLKPSNIMRRRSDGHIFLIDFGLTKIYADNGRPETSTTIGLGTPGYAPLEQSNKNSLRPTIDVYALGATLLKLLTAESIPSASDVLNDDEIIHNILSTYGINEKIQNAILKAMDPKPKTRLQSVQFFINLLPNLESNTSDSEKTIYDINSDIPNKKDLRTKTYIEVSSDPQRASVAIDGKWIGFAPIKIGVAPGKHEVKVANGASWSIYNGCVEVTDGHTAKIYAKLNQDTYIEVTSNVTSASVSIDGKWVGATPTKVKISPGRHDVKVTNGDRWTIYNKTIEATFGQTIQVRANLEMKDIVKVKSKPSVASVSKNDVLSGVAPNKNGNKKGKHFLFIVTIIVVVLFIIGYNWRCGSTAYEEAVEVIEEVADTVVAEGKKIEKVADFIVPEVKLEEEVLVVDSIPAEVEIEEVVLVDTIAAEVKIEEEIADSIMY